MRRKTRGWPSAPPPPSQATLRLVDRDDLGRSGRGGSRGLRVGLGTALSVKGCPSGAHVMIAMPPVLSTCAPYPCRRPTRRRRWLATGAALRSPAAPACAAAAWIARRPARRGASSCRDGARLPYRRVAARRRAAAPWCWRCTASTTAATPGRSRRRISPPPACRALRPGPARLRRGARPRRCGRGATRWSHDAARDGAAWSARRHPGVPLVLMGESMGGAVLMCLATRAARRRATRGYVLVAPAVWGRDDDERRSCAAACGWRRR